MSESCGQLAKAALAQLRSASGRPQGLEPFERVLAGDDGAGGITGERPLVGQLCKFVPEELVLASGAVPLRLDTGCQEAESRAEGHLSAEVCCAVKAFVGEWEERLSAWLERVELLVVPACCEAKKKLAGVLSPRQEIFLLEPPPSRGSEEARRWWYGQLERLEKRLQKLTGQKIKRSSLRQAIELVNRRALAARRLAEFQAAEHPPIGGADALAVIQTAFVSHPAWFTEKLEQLLRELEGFAPRAAARARVVLTGSPVLWPDWKLPLLLEECGAEIVGDDLCSGSEYLRHPAVPDEWTGEGMRRAAAERVWLPSVCPCLLGNESRRERLRELVKSARAGGVVHHTLRLCVPFDMEEAGLMRAFRAEGVPWLTLRADLGGQDTVRIKSRLQAFVDLLQANRRGPD